MLEKDEASSLKEKNVLYLSKMSIRKVMGRFWKYSRF
jgi:hypothetical protein